MKKRKLSRYEQMMLASAYNLQNYCDSTICDNCIFEQDSSRCILTTPSNPYNWELDRANK